MKISLQTLRTISVLYLALPLFVFFFGWLKLPIALLLSLMLAFLIRRSALILSPLHPFDRHDHTGEIHLSQMQIAGMITVALCWIFTSGVGGFGLQNGDYVKHNAILKTLIETGWPSVIQDAGVNDRLVYYFGYYLIPAAAGKILGWSGAYAVSFLWTTMGLLLAFLWIGLFARSYSIFTYLFFAFCGGLDIVGYFIENQALPGVTDHLEWWASAFQYSSHTTLLYWVPQHALAAWIATPLFISSESKAGPSFAPFLSIVLAFFWSPFVAIGIVPFALSSLIRTLKEARLGLRSRTAIVEAVTLGAIAVVLALFFESVDASRIPHYFVFDRLGTSTFFVKWLLFIALEVFCFLIFFEKISITLWVGVITLVLIPFYSVGMYNDFAMRVSVPALFVLFVSVIAELNRHFKARRVKGFLTPLFWVWLIGTGASVTELSRSLSASQGLWAQHIPQASWIPPIHRMGIPGAEAQYLGSKNSVFFRFLAKNP